MVNFWWADLTEFPPAVDSSTRQLTPLRHMSLCSWYRVTWLIHVRIFCMNHSYWWPDFFICVTWLIHMCHIHHSYVRHLRRCGTGTHTHTHTHTLTYVTHSLLLYTSFVCATLVPLRHRHTHTHTHKHTHTHTHVCVSARERDRDRESKCACVCVCVCITIQWPPSTWRVCRKWIAHSILVQVCTFHIFIAEAL